MKGLIPQPFIDQVLSQTDIIQLIDSYVPLKKQGTSYTACCPFHDEKTPSFNVIERKQFFHCFGCGASGNAIGFIMDYLNQSFPEAIETLAARLGLSIPYEQHQKNQIKQQKSLYDVLELVNKFFIQNLQQSPNAGITYLKARQLSHDVIQQFQLGFAQSSWHDLSQRFKDHIKSLIATGMLIQKDNGHHFTRYRNRIMFPIHDHTGRLVGFGGRAIESSQKPKYLNSPETVIFQKSRELYGLYQTLCLTKKPSYILVVEGYMDVIALHQNGFHTAVATLGTATSTHHIQRLMRYTSHIIFCFDGDTAGQKAALKALDSALFHLDGALEVSFIFLPEGQDPDSIIQSDGSQAFQKRIDTALPLHQFLFNTLTQNLDLQKLSAKSQLIHAFQPYWQKIPQGPYQPLLIDQLARLSHLSPDQVESILNQGSHPAKAPQLKSKPFKRTPLRVAIALLIQNPKLFSLNSGHLPAANAFVDPNQKLLKDILMHLSQYPDSTTASIVERFRETHFFSALQKLAVYEHLVPEDSQDVELIEILNFLTQKNDIKQVDSLIEKARNQTISDEERKYLQSLLLQKHHQ